ncbi:MAG TPA: RNA polymerase sigma factor [Rhizomicrobium sp.]|nr:RNA polymerase sigma factor [Rhizomicrobium sp.]
MPAIPSAQLWELSEKARTPLRRYFERRIRGRGDADAEDLVQEVFLRLARAKEADVIENLDGYVCRIAANLARDHVRRRAVRKGDIVIDAEGFAGEGDFTPERILLGRDAVRQVERLLDELPPKTKTIFLLYHAEVMPQLQIARAMQMPLSTIEKHMCRASAHLHRKLERKAA